MNLQKPLFVQCFYEDCRVVNEFPPLQPAPPSTTVGLGLGLGRGPRHASPKSPSASKLQRTSGQGLSHAPLTPDRLGLRPPRPISKLKGSGAGRAGRTATHSPPMNAGASRTAQRIPAAALRGGLGLGLGAAGVRASDSVTTGRFALPSDGDDDPFRAGDFTPMPGLCTRTPSDLMGDVDIVSGKSSRRARGALDDMALASALDLPGPSPGPGDLEEAPAAAALSFRFETETESAGDAALHGGHLANELEASAYAMQMAGKLNFNGVKFSGTAAAAGGLDGSTGTSTRTRTAGPGGACAGTCAVSTALTFEFGSESMIEELEGLGEIENLKELDFFLSSEDLLSLALL